MPPRRPQDRACAWLLLPCLASGCFAATSAPQDPQAPPYDHRLLHRKAAVHPGAIDSGDRYRSILQVIVPQFFAGVQPRDGQCSGNLIAPRLVLTAAHCVCRKRKSQQQDLNDRANEPGVPAGNSPVRAMFIKTEDVDAIVEPSTCVKNAIVKAFVYQGSGAPTTEARPVFEKRGEIRTPKNLKILFDHDFVVSSTADLALIVLDEPVDGKLFPVYKLPDAEVQPGDRVTVVGYGSEPEVFEYGTRRSGGNQISWIQELGAGNVEIVAGAQALADGGMASHIYLGDSGGGCFKADDDKVLVGVISSYAEDAKGNVYSVMTSVYANRLWLLRQIVESRGQLRPNLVAPP